MPHANPEQRRQYHKDYITRRLQDPEYRARRNAVANARMRKVKDWLNAYKVEHGCIDCGYNAHPVALDIDHIDGKTSNVSSLKSIAAIQREMERHACVVRCANCHRIKSHETETWKRVYPCKPDIFRATYEEIP